MKNILYLFIVFILLTGCYNQDRNCQDFKTGKFSFEYDINGEKKTTIFERTETLEIETFEGKTDTSSVRWINDCEFIVKNLQPKNMAERQPLHFKILTTTEDSYTFEYGLVGQSKKQRGTAKKID